MIEILLPTLLLISFKIFNDPREMLSLAGLSYKTIFPQDATLLEQPFSSHETKEAVWDLSDDRSPGLMASHWLSLESFWT